MMKVISYSYQLSKRGKWICPNCGRKTYVCYVDINGNVLDTKVGKCDRADKCNYHYPPRQYFSDNDITDRHRALRRIKPIYQPQPKYTYIDADKIFKPSVNATLTHSNNLVDYFLRTLKVGYNGSEDETLTNEYMGRRIEKVMCDYYVGTSKHFGGGSTVFYQVDKYGRIHRGKVMKYDADTGKRVKEPYPLVTTAHKLLGLGGELPPQCLFGEHLLYKHQDKSVVMVESEKTALIMACFVDDAIVLATGGCGNLTDSMCEVLRGRQVVLIPDNGKYQEWKEKGASMASKFAKLEITDIMERDETKASYQFNDGDDIGDLILAWFPFVNDMELKPETI